MGFKTGMINNNDMLALASIMQTLFPLQEASVFFCTWGIRLISYCKGKWVKIGCEYGKFVTCSFEFSFLVALKLYRTQGM